MSWVMITVPNNTRLTWKRGAPWPSLLLPHRGSQGEGSLGHLKCSQKFKTQATYFSSSNPTLHPWLSSQTLFSSSLGGGLWPTNSPMSSRLWRFPLLLALLKPGFRWDTSFPTGTQGPVASHTECTSRLAGGESLISAHATVQASSASSQNLRLRPSAPTTALQLSTVGPSSSWGRWLQAPGPAPLLLSSGCLQHAYKWTIHIPGLSVSRFCPPSQPRTSTPPVTP